MTVLVMSRDLEKTETLSARSQNGVAFCTLLAINSRHASGAADFTPLRIAWLLQFDREPVHIFIVDWLTCLVSTLYQHFTLMQEKNKPY